MTDQSIDKSIYLKAPTSDVWAYLTEPDKLALWFHAPKTALTEGEDFAMCGKESGKPMIWGHVSKAFPFTNLEYSFIIAPMGDGVSQVKWHLQEVAGGTRLSLTHTGLPQDLAGFDLMLALDKGWDDHLAKLRTNLNH